MNQSLAKNVVVLGSTGSIGTQTLDVLQFHQQQFTVYALVANSNLELIFAQCQKFKPKYAFLANDTAASELRQRLRASGSSTDVFSGAQALDQLVQDSAVDIVVAGIVGSAGLPSIFAAAKAGKRILLANKEALVMAGDLLMSTIKETGAELLPIDSEHNAIFQALPDAYVPGNMIPESVHSVVLTASGGPFLQYPLDQFACIEPSQAVAHPNWSMGAKISVDSATMMNKALEVIEAYYLFSLAVKQIDVWVHPQSIVHSLVRYRDGTSLAQMGEPDMRTPITHCLGWPRRLGSEVSVLDLAHCPDLSFASVDSARFPCFEIGLQALNRGQAAVVVLNAANEIAVQAFLDGQLRYVDIAQLIDKVLQKCASRKLLCLDDVMDLDREARRSASAALEKMTCRN